MNRFNSFLSAIIAWVDSLPRKKNSQKGILRVLGFQIQA